MDYLKNIEYCFRCQTQDVVTPVPIIEAEDSLDELGLVYCSKHIKDAREWAEVGAQAEYDRQKEEGLI